MLSKIKLPFSSEITSIDKSVIDIFAPEIGLSFSSSTFPRTETVFCAFKIVVNKSRASKIYFIGLIKNWYSKSDKLKIRFR